MYNLTTYSFLREPLMVHVENIFMWVRASLARHILSDLAASPPPFTSMCDKIPIDIAHLASWESGDNRVCHPLLETVG
jgi:hypothetical protein